MDTEGETVGRPVAHLWAWLIFSILCLILVAACFIWLPSDVRFVAALTPGGLAALGFFGYASSRAERFTLYPDRIEKRGLFRTRSWRLDDIVSVSRISEGMALRMQSRFWPPVLPFYLFKNPAWLAWIEGVRNTDFEAFEKARAAVDADDVLGGNVDERRQTADHRVKIARGIGLASTVLALWTLFLPKPDFLPVYICCVVPPLALIVSCAFPTVFRVLPGAAPTRIDLGYPASMAALGLAATSFASPIVDWPEALAAAALGGAVAAIISAVLLTGVKVERSILGGVTGVVVGCYIWGGGIFMNIREDNRPPLLAEVRVTDTSGSLRDEPALSMDIAAPEPFKVSHQRVPRHTFAAHKAGQPLCAIVHPGRLGWRWMRVWPCREVVNPTGRLPLP